MNNLKLFIIISFFASNLAFGQEKIPKISGIIKISVEQGTIEGDIVLSDYPHTDDYLIRLNKGLNILNIQSLEPEKFVLEYDLDLAETIQTNETNSYFFPSSKQAEKLLPTSLRFRYMGKFPVISDNLAENQQRIDWRGNIAFKNDLLRMDGKQSAWLPTLYNVTNDFQFEKSKYDIEIICEDCDHIYLNGNEPVSSSIAHLKSEIPRELFLFVGKYNVQNSEKITVLNGNLSQQEITEFDKLNSHIINYLEGYTGIPYKGKVYWVQAYNSSLEKGNFAFASYPTFTLCGSHPPNNDLKSYINKNKEKVESLIPHELSHYYFGTLKICNNDLEEILNEGFAQFLAFKYISQFEEREYIKEGVLESLEWFEDPEFEYKAMLDFNNSNQTNDRQTYAYDYQTSILFSIEKEIGEEKMKKWIRLLLHGEEPISNKDFFKSTLKKAINNDKIYNDIISKYLIGDLTVENMKKLWTEK